VLCGGAPCRSGKREWRGSTGGGGRQRRWRRAASPVAARAEHATLIGLTLVICNTCVALAIESNGRRDTEIVNVLQELAQVAASSGRVAKRASVHAALCRFFAASAKGNGRMYTASCFAMARAQGHDLETGLAAQVADFAGGE
jgi:hypothetical protein